MLVCAVLGSEHDASTADQAQESLVAAGQVSFLRSNCPPSSPFARPVQWHSFTLVYQVCWKFDSIWYIRYCSGIRTINFRVRISASVRIGGVVGTVRANLMLQDSPSMLSIWPWRRTYVKRCTLVFSPLARSTTPPFFIVALPNIFAKVVCPGRANSASSLHPAWQPRQAPILVLMTWDLELGLWRCFRWHIEWALSLTLTCQACHVRSGCHLLWVSARDGAQDSLICFALSGRGSACIICLISQTKCSILQCLIACRVCRQFYRHLFSHQSSSEKQFAQAHCSMEPYDRHGPRSDSSSGSRQQRIDGISAQQKLPSFRDVRSSRVQAEIKVLIALDHTRPFA